MKNKSTGWTPERRAAQSERQKRAIAEGKMHIPDPAVAVLDEDDVRNILALYCYERRAMQSRLARLDEEREELASRIRGLTHRALADKWEVGVSTIQAVLRGQYKPRKVR